MSFRSYSNYKNSGIQWLGMIPEHWQVVPYKRLVDIQNGRDHKAVEQDQGYPVIGSGGPFTFASDYLYDGESVLLGRKGTIDKPIYINGRFWTVDTMYWSKIRSGVFGKFAYYAAKNIPFDYYLTSTTIPSMTKGTLGNNPVALPPITEQQQIADFLDRETSRIDQLIEKKERLLSVVNEREDTALRSLLSGTESSATGRKSTNTPWLPSVPSHWDIIPLRHLVRITTGSRDTQDRTDDGQYPFYVRSMTVERIDTYSHDEEAVLTSGDGAGVGKVFHHVTGKFELHQRMYAFTDFKHMTGSYFFHFLRTFFHLQMTQWSAKSTVDSVRMPFLKSMLFAIPPRDEQESILNVIDARRRLDERIVAATETSIERLRELRTALITAAVTGQIDVATWGKQGQTDRRLDRIEEAMRA